MKFQQIRSALSIVEFAGVRFMIDPMLAPKNTYPVFPYTCVTGEGNPTTDLPVSLESLFDVDAVIVTHGGVIAAIMAHLFPEGKNRYEWQSPNGGGYVIEDGEYTPFSPR